MKRDAPRRECPLAAWAALAGLVLVALPGCGGAPPVQAPAAARLIQDVAYAPGVTLDVHAPSGAARLPVMVLLHGCCGSKDDLGQLAEAIAARGAVVFNASWRNLANGGGYPLVYQQAACAVSFARANAASYGGDPGRVALLGWSDGALLAGVVANAGDRFLRACAVHGVSALPDALIGVAGFFGWPPRPAGMVDRRYVNARTIRFFGGTPAGAPRAWAGGNPYTELGRNRRLGVWLVAADGDPLLGDAKRFLAALRRVGRPARLVVVAGASQGTLVIPRLPDGEVTVREALDAARGP